MTCEHMPASGGWWLAAVIAVGVVILYLQGREIMASIEPIKAAFTELKDKITAHATEVSEEIAHIKAQADKIIELIQNQGDPAEIEALAAEIRGEATKVGDLTTALDTATAETPLPEPPPAPPEG